MKKSARKIIRGTIASLKKEFPFLTAHVVEGGTKVKAIKKEKMVTISVNIPTALYNQVKKLAKEEGITLNEFIVRAIQEYIKNNK